MRISISLYLTSLERDTHLQPQSHLVMGQLLKLVMCWVIVWLCARCPTWSQPDNSVARVYLLRTPRDYTYATVNGRLSIQLSHVYLYIWYSYGTMLNLFVVAASVSSREGRRPSHVQYDAWGT